MLAVLAYLGGSLGITALITGYAAEDTWIVLARLLRPRRRPMWAVGRAHARRLAHHTRKGAPTMRQPKCPGCPGRRHSRQYLCLTCWRALPSATRGRLTLRDSHAHARLRHLLAELEAGTPVEIIRVGR